MDLDFRLDKVIEVIDLIKRLSWGAIPIWFSLTLPIIYIAYTKLLSQPQGNTNATTDKIVIYTCLILFATGTITLLIDQHQKEKIRNDGLRMKQYFLAKNNYAVSKNSLTTGQFRLQNLSSKDIDNVLKLYPNEFLEIDEGTIILRDSVPIYRIMETSQKLLDSYLSNPLVAETQDLDSLFETSPFFTREVIYKLVVDSPQKYTFCLSTCGVPSIVRKK